MFKVGEYLVYRKDVCKLVDIKKNYLNNNDYYVLIQVFNDSLKIEIPISNSRGNLRSLITKEEIEAIINQIPDIEIIECDNRFIESEYKKLMTSSKHGDLVKIIKTTYLRNKERTDKKKKISDIDNNYFNQAEKYLYEEFSIVLEMSIDDTKKYVIGAVNKIHI